MNATLIKLMCVLPMAVCSEPVDWGFVQAVGGIALAEVTKHNDDYSLAVKANISGLAQVTVKPTLVNSALICERTEAVVRVNKIYLTIYKGIIRDGYNIECPPARLGHIQPGQYQVFYQSHHDENHFIGDILIETE